MYIW